MDPDFEIHCEHGKPKWECPEHELLPPDHEVHCEHDKPKYECTDCQHGPTKVICDKLKETKVEECKAPKPTCKKVDHINKVTVFQRKNPHSLSLIVPDLVHWSS